LARFSAKLRKPGLREETIGHAPSKEKWEALTLTERRLQPAIE
jgi:hypothetical protein